jgi:uncharacterized protein (TIGR03118 family)
VKRRLCAEKSEGRGGSASKQVSPQPGTIPALGLRAETMAFSLYRRPALERRKIMVFSSWLRNWKRFAPAPRRRRQTSPRPRVSFRPRLEALEDRWVPSGYQQINLVSYQPGIGHFTDANLNGWGMTSMPDGSFVVSNTFSTGLATFCDYSGHVLPQTITVPGSAAGSAALGLGPGGHPTGVVYNPTSDFVISEGGKSAPARLLFDSIDGTISGWNPDVDPTHAIPIPGRDTFANGKPSIYTGLEIRDNVLYATDFYNNRVEMIDGSFNTIGYFSDPTVTSFADGSFSAWSVQAVNNKLYVTFASLKDFDGGVVDVFNTHGNLLRHNHFAANGPGVGGPLQNPWGITQAPANFGAYSNDLLIGNVAGAGNINVFDPNTGAYLGKLQQPNGAPIAIKGLWDLEFGDGTPNSGNTNQLFFDAGPNKPGDSTGGLFGVIQAAEAPTVNGSVLSNNSVGLSSSLPNISSASEQEIAALSLMSKATTMVPASDLNAMPASRESRLETMDPQLSTFLSMFNADMEDAWETMIGQM